METSEPGEAVFADERQARIAELVSATGRVHNSELARRFDVSEPTIRKDLSALQQRGLVKRTHGGAIALQPLVDRELAGREATQPDAKQAIARACLALIENGQAIFLDNGTTVGAMAAGLVAEPANRRSNLTVLTNALDVARTVAECPAIEHVLLGGQLSVASESVTGALTLYELRRFTVDVAFIGVSGFSEVGISVAGIAEAAVKAAVIERARRVVVAVDHTKVDAIDFARICELDEIDTVVMDHATPQTERLCARHDLELLVATE